MPLKLPRKNLLIRRKIELRSSAFGFCCLMMFIYCLSGFCRCDPWELGFRAEPWFCSSTATLVILICSIQSFYVFSLWWYDPLACPCRFDSDTVVGIHGGYSLKHTETISLNCSNCVLTVFVGKHSASTCGQSLEARTTYLANIIREAVQRSQTANGFRLFRLKPFETFET